LWQQQDDAAARVYMSVCVCVCMSAVDLQLDFPFTCHSTGDGLKQDTTKQDIGYAIYRLHTINLKYFTIDT